MSTCYLIDDEEHAIDTLTNYISRSPGLDLIGSSINPLIAINNIINNPVDIVFLDVDMPELSGLDVADILSPITTVIFTTAFPNYALQAFEKNGSDFLLKPISFDRFTKSVIKVQKLIENKKSIEITPTNNESESFFINPGVKGKMVQLNYSDILYIEGLKNYIVIYTTEGKHITYLSMKEFEKAIPGDRFIRIHKSYIINLNKIKSIDGNNVIMVQNSDLPIGISFKENFFNVIDTKTIRSGRKH